jgi:type III pantothenate kinase
MSLLVDMGNTRLKWAVLANGQLLVGKTLLNEQINQQVLFNLWQHITPPKQLVIACVTASHTLELVMAVAVSLWSDIKIRRVRSQTQTFGVTNAYTPPEKLGVDRWLALVAARHAYTIPACVVDCGTAITVDLLDERGQHLGGLISAGLMLMRKALAGGTDALPFSDTRYPLDVANFTEAAIYSGTLWAAVGLIEQVLEKQTPMTVILTGGDAVLIAPHLSVTPIVDPDLVLHGLAIVA